jgi:PAS domain S-box-containing protein
MNRSLYRTITVGLVVLVAIISIFATTISYWLLSYRSKLVYEHKSVEFIGFLQQSLSTPVWEVDDEGVKSICAAFAEHETVSLLRVKDVNGNVLFDKSNKESAIWAQKRAKIMYQDKMIGSIELGLTPKSYDEISFQLFIASVFTMLLVITGLVIGIKLILQNTLKKPLDQLIKCTHQISKGEFHPLEDSSPYDEVTTILNSFSQMVEAIYHRELELASANRKLALHVENTPLAVIEWDLDFRVAKWNKAAEQIFGYSKSEAIGRTGLDLIVPKEARPLVEGIWQDLLSGKGGQKNRSENIKKNGDICIADWYNTTLFGENKDTIGVASLVLDITERTQAEEESKKLESQLRQGQKMESIGTLAGGIAHDFNNILFPILGHTEMLIEDVGGNSPIRDSLNEILTGALRAKELVKQILTFSRQENTELKLLKIQLIIKEALKLIRSTIPTTIDIKQDIQADCGLIKADPTQMHQIIMNLTTNAYHSMEDTGGELKVTLKEVELEKDDLKNPDMVPGIHALLTISDQGIGMDHDLTEKIFDPFFTTKGKGKGTGMGLSVVHGIVKRMKGAIQLYSEPDIGSEFKLYFPIEKKSFTEPLVQTDIALQGGTENILLVDDEEGILIMEKRLLERMGYQVTSCISSIEALAIFNSDPGQFDLVISDMAMPGLSGDKLAVELIKIQPDLSILLCTGFSDGLSEKKMVSLGIKGFLMKPITMKVLAQKIREVLDGSKKDSPS